MHTRNKHVKLTQHFFCVTDQGVALVHSIDKVYDGMDNKNATAAANPTEEYAAFAKQVAVVCEQGAQQLACTATSL
jgi:hypothetical protein